ncbi:MAG: hypothetical protein ACE5K8_00605 [Candidatus Zixiibacteriota bacterium]
MRNLKWYYLLGIAIGLIALGVVAYWVFRTGGLLAKLTAKQAEEIKAAE